MTRKNIFEILKEKYDINREITKITTLFDQIRITATNPLTFKSETNANTINNIS